MTTGSGTLRITVLGCGGSAGVPQIGGPDGFGDWGACDRAEPRNRRTRSSIVVAGDRGSLLVDTSPDMRTQLLACGVPKVDAILFTHAHADHIIGVDDVRGLNRAANKPLDAFATQRTLDELEKRFDYAFKPWQPPMFFRPVLVPRAIRPGDVVETAGLRVQTFDQDHGFIRSLGLRVGGFGYSTDVVALDDTAFELLAGIDTWLIGCFQRQAHKTHADVELVLSWVARLRPRRTVLTHMGHDLDWAWMTANLPPGVEPAYDGQILTI